MWVLIRPGITIWPVASIVSVPRNCLADGVGGVHGHDVGAVDGHGAVAESRGASPSTVTTVPPVTTSDTCRGALAARTAATRHRAHTQQRKGGEHPAHGPDSSSAAFGYYAPTVPLHLVPHPLALDALAELRNKDTLPAAFRAAAHRLSTVVVTEALRDLPSAAGDGRDAARARATAPRLRDDIVLVPVLRAGLGMLDAALTLVPSARVGHIGLRRDEDTALPSRYYARLPERLQDSSWSLIDPMLATGGSAAAALDLMKAAGAREPAPDLPGRRPGRRGRARARASGRGVYTPVVDSHLNDRKFIVPGLGDFGDRLYGTE